MVALVATLMAAGTVNADVQEFFAFYVLKEVMDRLQPEFGHTPRLDDYTEFMKAVKQALEADACSDANRLHLQVYSHGDYALTVVDVPGLIARFDQEFNRDLAFTINREIRGGEVGLRELFQQVGFCVTLVDGYAPETTDKPDEE